MRVPSITIFTALLVTAGGNMATAQEPWQEKIHPAAERRELEPGRDYRLIVTVGGDRNDEFEAFLREVSSPARGTSLDEAWIRVLGAYEVVSGGGAMKKLLASPAVVSAWVVPGKLGERYAPLLRSVAYAIENLPPGSASNVSLGPPVGRGGTLFDPEEPMHRLTRIAAEKGITFVFSAGNEGPDENTLNPWGLADWTLSVGAASADGKTLWERSSRGVAGSERLQPTFVAPGIDRITTHPESIPKTREQLEAEKRVDFESRVPEEKRARWTVVTGTSIAAAEASRCVALLLHFLREEVRLRIEAKGEMVLELGFPRDRKLGGRRWVGSVRIEGDDQIVSYPLHRPDPLVIKQLLIDVAEPMPGYAPHEVGAGFVSYELVLHHFGKHGEPNPEILPVKGVDG